MAENSGISWTHNTWNPWRGCHKVAPECAKCYINRPIQGRVIAEFGKVERAAEWELPWKWEAECIKTGKAKRVFTCSYSDFFHKNADLWRREAWAIIKHTPHLVWLILTKRPERIKANLPPDWGEGYKNVWLGVSVGSRQRLVSMGALRSIRAAVRWVSCEPLLEDISADISLDGFGWVVTGGESGPGTEYLWDSAGNWRAEFNTAGRRTMQLQWAERLRDKTKATGLPFLFKQITHLRPGHGVNALGRIWHEFPAPPSGFQSDWATGSDVVSTAHLLHEWNTSEGRGPIRVLTAESEYETEQALKQIVDADIANGRIKF